MNNNNTTYKPLGDYIRPVDVRNKDLKVTTLLGLSVSKEFMPSIANTIGTDMSTYKIVGTNQFVYIADTSRRGDKIAIALWTQPEKAIVSSIYTVFEIVDREKLLPEYLMMWFRRPEFDRYARYHSHGSAREIFDWAEMCATMVPVPPISEQRAVVADYEAVARRIAVAKRTIATLQATAQALYRKMFVDGIDKENLPEGWRWGKLGEYATVKSGFAFKSDWWQKDGIPVIKIGDIVDNTICKNTCDCVSKNHALKANNYKADAGDIVIAMTGATLGKFAIVPTDGFVVNQRVGLFNLGNNSLKKAAFLMVILMQPEIQNEILTVGGDSAQENVSNSDIENIKIAFPPKEILSQFNIYGEKLISHMILKFQEIEKLTEIQTIILSGMGR